MAKKKRGSTGTKGFVFGFLFFGVLGAFTLTPAVQANPQTNRPAAAAPKKAAPADPKKGFRKKELSFEERVIEGLSNRGYDSLSQSGTADGLKGEKLYRKRAEFDDDSKSMLREMEYLK